jgi:serine-aspartate repeat-containing protein C/D/E
MRLSRSTRAGTDPTIRPQRTRRRGVAALVAGILVTTGVAAVPVVLSGVGASAATIVQGKTWLDLNKNGTQDVTTNLKTNEPSLPGVPVTVTAANGEVKTTASAANGQWQVTMDAPAPYRVEFGAFPQVGCPAATSCITTGPRVGGTTVQFNGGQGTVNLGAFAKLDSLGALEALTETETVEIGDRVWSDLNGNGIQDPGEPGIAGVTVSLVDQFTGNPGGQTAVNDAKGI